MPAHDPSDPAPSPFASGAAVSSAAVSSAAVPDVAVPDVALPDVALPDVAVPDVALPDAHAVDERLTTLELKLMDVERTLEALDAVILAQARELETLRAERARLEARVDSLADGLGDAPAAADERPPHY